MSPSASRTRPSTSHSTGPGARSRSRASSGSVPRLRATANASRPDGAAAFGVAGGSSRSNAVSAFAARAVSFGSRLARRNRAARSASSSFAAVCPGRSRASSTSAAAIGWPARSSASARRPAISSLSGSARASSRKSATVFSCAALSGRPRNARGSPAPHRSAGGAQGRGARASAPRHMPRALPRCHRYPRGRGRGP
jgi:hypothetical protein